jgi:HAD superfamily hydrolase (TIGR01549 family)
MFDLDGTILDSIDTWWRAFNDGVAVFQLGPVPKERLLGFMNEGARLAEILVGFYPELGTEAGSAKIGDIMEEIRKKYPTNTGAKIDLATGAVELLGLLKQRGLKIGVVTSRAMVAEKQWQELEELEVAHLFDAVVTASDSRKKPAPDTVIECLECLGVLPEECVIVGDSLADIIAGKAAGVKTVAVTTGVADLPTLTVESPDFIFDSLPSLISELDLVLGGD